MVVMRRPGTSRWAGWLDTGYNRLGCAPFIVLFIIVVIGLKVTTQAADVAVICLQFGPDAYFRGGLRAVGTDFFQLNNGQRVAGPYQWLFVLLWVITFVPWTLVALLGIIGVNNYVERRREKRRRSEA
jgi:hypothetical protein